MATRKLKKDVEYYFSQIKRAKNYKDRLAMEYEWEELRNTMNTAGLYVEGTGETWKRVETEHTQSGYVNWPWAFKESFIPAVYSQQPEIYVYPKSSMHVQNAHNVQENVNATLNSIGYEKELKRCLLDALVYGHAWMKLGWYTRFGQVPKGAGAEEGDKISKLNMDMDLIYDSAYSYRCCPELIHVDPEAERYEDIRWLAQEYFEPYDQVQDDPFLKYTKDATALGYKEVNDEIPSIFEKPDREPSKRSWCRIYEIWDREEQEVMILIDGCDKFSRRVDGFPYSNIHGFPFKFLSLNDAVDKFYPPSPILAWYPMVSELSFVRQMRMEHMQKMVNKVCSEKQNIDEENLERLRDTEQDYFEVHEIDKVRDFRGLTPDANLYACEQKIEENIRDISGFSELISGSVPYSKLTATTSQIAAQHATIRFQHATTIVSSFIKECAKDLFYIIRDYQEYPVSVRISDDPRINLSQITRDQLEGEYDFRILVEDMSYISRSERVKMSYDMLIALSPFPETRNETLIRKFLEANGAVNLREYMHPPMGPPVDPMYENSLMARGIPVEVNPNEDFELHLRVHNEWISSPAYQQLVARMPAIQQLVSGHIQKTTRAFEEYQAKTGGDQPRAGVNSQTQQGQQLASSTPQGGPRNQQGPQGGQGAKGGQGDLAGLMQALTQQGG